ncbi:Endothelin-converting enzyme-like 1 [Platysternon megacephalum]|uniref:Endothelin-converting enzyme-like 1 n=1 Tax=Platysternon megacephalum TaxID=55544 RepID=A0A4D9DCV2_9SAUR|nr:Endothelin-converting enzyme-like 1 [Platysternon megacephalum]
MQDTGERDRDRLAELITTLASEEHPHGSPQQQVGALFADYCDTEHRDRLGASPLAPDLAVLADITTGDSLLRACGELSRAGITTLLGDELVNDVEDPTRYQLIVWQAGLTLPDEAYYREDQHAELREQLPHFVNTLLGLCAEALPGGIAPADAGQRILAFETRLASHHWDAVTCRDTDAILNPMTIAQMSEASGAPWEAYFDGTHAPAAVNDNLVVGQPSYLNGIGEMLREVDLTEWTLWLTWRIVCDRAGLLHTPAYQAIFDFISRKIRGAKEPDKLERRAVQQCSGILPIVVGRVYVEAFTPPRVKDAVRELMEDCRAAMGDTIAGSRA